MVLSLGDLIANEGMAGRLVCAWQVPGNNQAGSATTIDAVSREWFAQA